MKRCLILLTSEFPYSDGETFLESEIGFHKDNFEKIIILAIDLQKYAKKNRSVPDNADCYNVTQVDKKAGRAKDVLFGVLNCVKPKTELYNYDKDVIGTSLKKRLFFEYFCNRAEREYGYCKEILNKYDFTQYDEVVVYSYWLFVPALIGIKIKNELSSYCKNVKCISRAHGYDLYEYRNKLQYLPLRGYILENTDNVYPCSLDGQRYLGEKYPEFSKKIKASYLGTFDRGISECKKDKAFRIISCSNILDVKRIDRIVDSLAMLKTSDLNIKWIHIGDGVLRESIENSVKEKIPFADVKFAGRITNAQVYEMYKNCTFDLFVNTSTHEGLPVSIMEAISFGIPVIATDVGGVSEIIEDGYNGFLLSGEFSTEELAGKIKYFANLSDKEIKAFRENSRKMWEDKFNAENNYRKFSAEII